MGKITSIVAVVLLLGNPVCSIAAGSNRDIRHNVIDTLVSYLWVKEATGNNDGYMVEKMLQSAGAKKGDPWCGAFQAYVFKVNGLKIPQYAARASAWFDKKHIIPNNNAVAGDLGSIYYRKPGRIGHIVMYLKPYKNETPYVVTGEGNTNADGSREGNRAAKKLRPRGVIYSSANWIDQQ
ncbi:MAG: C40 family peptidase [Prolixibacteraceae bacterium]|nr:C40 family peptidase [Prolixibacteraceae bacterium]